MTDKMRDYKLDSSSISCSCVYREKSKECNEAIKAILKHNNKRLEECIEKENLDLNERFDTSYVTTENFLNYACNNSNYEAAKIIAERKRIVLSPYDKERLLLELLSKRKPALLYKLMSDIESKRIKLTRFLIGIIKQDYEYITEDNARKLEK